MDELTNNRTVRFLYINWLGVFLVLQLVYEYIASANKSKWKAFGTGRANYHQVNFPQTERCTVSAAESEGWYFIVLTNSGLSTDPFLFLGIREI